MATAACPLTLSNNNCWQDNVSQDTMEMIINKLNIGDWVRMAAVCKSWRSTTRKAIAICVEEAPWLMLPYEPWSRIMSFYSLSEERIYKFDMPELSWKGRGGWCCGSCKGWLLISAGPYYNPDIFLWNPIAEGNIIKLPPLKSIPIFKDVIKHKYNDVSSFIRQVDISFSDHETSSETTRSNIVVAVIAGDYSSQMLALCSPGDLEWTIYDGQAGKTNYGGILFHERILYASVFNRKIENAEDETDDNNETDTISLTHGVQLKLILFQYFIPRQLPEDHINDNEITYQDGFTVLKGIEPGPILVESTSGKLLAVHKICDIFTKVGFDVEYFHYHTRKFEVTPTWDDGTPLTNLGSGGDQAIFVGSTSSFCLAIPTRDSNSTKGFIKSNCIYFALRHQSNHEFDIVSNDSGIFNLDDEKVRRCFPTTTLSMTSKIDWFTPRISQSNREIRETHDSCDYDWITNFIY